MEPPPTFYCGCLKLNVIQKIIAQPEIQNVIISSLSSILQLHEEVFKSALRPSDTFLCLLGFGVET